VNEEPDRIPIACRLSKAELREREETLIARFKSAVISTEEVPDGFLFRIPADKSCVAATEAWVAAERECCPFMTFSSARATGAGLLEVRVTGPAGTKEFLRAILRLPEQIA
jgi:hypothetical protein